MKYILLLLLVPGISLAQKRYQTENKFDGVVTITFDGGLFNLDVPSIVVKKSNNETGRPYIVLSQYITSEQFVHFSRGPLQSLELLMEDGTIYPIDDDYLKENTYADSKSSFAGGYNVRYAAATVDLDTDLVQQFRKAKGWRINKLGEGKILVGKNIDKFRKMLDMFTEEFTEYR